MGTSGESVAVQSVTFNATTQFAVLQLARAVTPADAVAKLTITNFRASFNSGDNGGSGFFLSNNTYSPSALRDQPLPRRAKGGTRRFPDAPVRPWLQHAPPGKAAGRGGMEMMCVRLKAA